MQKRTLVLVNVAALIVGFWIGWFCNYSRTGLQQVDPVAAARRYVLAHHAVEFGPSGTALSYVVEDHGDVWIVEVSQQGQVGGGTRLMIRRAGGRIELIGRTQ